MPTNPLNALLSHHVTGAIERGESQAIAEIPAPRKAYQAYSSHGARTADTPRAAAEAYFAKYPKSRKCDVIEGNTTDDGLGFTIAVSRITRAKKWEAITPKTLHTLPATNA